MQLVAYGVGLLGVALAVRYYLELRKWARQCQNARIVISHKRRVRLNAPLTDWLVWANSLGRDETMTGRIIYTADKTQVAIIRPDKRKKGPRVDERSRATTGVANG